MEWIVREEGYQKESIEFFGSKFTIGNGYMGYRGTLEEYGKKELTACTLSELYDDSGNGWREIINAPNALYTRTWFDGEELSVLNKKPCGHWQQVDLYGGVHSRKTLFETKAGVISIEADRFVSLENIHLLVMRYQLCAQSDVYLTVQTGFDKDIWELNGPHFKEARYFNKDGRIYMHGRTVELGKELAVGETVQLLAEKGNIKEDENLHTIDLTLKAGVPAGFVKFVSVCKCTDCTDPMRQVDQDLSEAEIKGWESLLTTQKKLWKEHWKNFDVRLDGDEEGQIALRHSIFLLLVSAPFHTDTVAIPARGLSGQVYKGGMFWDTELYFLQMFLHCAPQVARNLMMYRIRNLKGAKEKAKEFGYSGAFYPWESQETGKDGCTLYNLTDIFTGRPVRTYFKDKQIHISAAVAYGISCYYRATGDVSILLEGGAETLLECGEFFYSYSYFKPAKNRFELLDVTGADEYHERVNNDAYTNAMVKMTLESAMAAVELIKNKYPKDYEKLRTIEDFDEKCRHIKEMNESLYVPMPDKKTKLIEQYDGFFKMEDCSLEELKSRIINPNEYLGSPIGLAVNTQIAKQADVVLMLTVLGENYSQEVKKANWEYYEPRCEHGSSLSTCVYALLAAQIGLTDWAYRYFLKAAQLDLKGDYKLYLGTLYIGGTHPAANGGSWMVAVLGFGGLKMNAGYAEITPRLPVQWRGMSYSFQTHGLKFHAQITARHVEVTADADNKESYELRAFGKSARCLPGETVSFEEE